MVCLTREQILATSVKREFVEVPEWGGGVYVKEMDGAGIDEWEQAISATGRENARAVTLVRCIVDESGARLFQDGDATELGTKSGLALSRCAEAFRRLNKLGGDQEEKNRGNSEPDRSGDSASA